MFMILASEETFHSNKKNTLREYQFKKKIQILVSFLAIQQEHNMINKFRYN